MKTEDQSLNTANALVKRRVLNVHRQRSDYSQAQRDAHKGVIVGILPGCNPLVRVLFDGRTDSCWMVQADLAFEELWPNEGCRVVIPAELCENTPNPEQQCRLDEFKRRFGTAWKSKLGAMWADGRDADQPDGHLLRQLRNELGPSWLAKQK